uniref:Sorting nexin-24 n=1 Tax=Bos mutus grunniens TaxID=30521 RepID=A0A8C0A8V7_BOSMU
MEVYIPSFRYEESDLERGYTVFKIEVLMNGRKHFVEKRYSEFHALHKKLKKCIKTPEIPSKHVRNWVPKVLEQRRQGLETYLQAVILENEELPKLFLDFLNVRHLPSLPKTESYGSFDETESEESSKLSHQPVLLFLRDPYVLPAASVFILDDNDRFRIQQQKPRKVTDSNSKQKILQHLCFLSMKMQSDRLDSEDEEVFIFVWEGGGHIEMLSLWNTCN